MLVQTKTSVEKSTPVLDTNALADGDVACAATEIKNVFGTTRSGVLVSLGVVDKAKTLKGFSVHFFSAQPSGIPALNAALDLTDADAELWLGKVAVTTADFVSFSSSAVARIALTDIDSIPLVNTDNSESIWYVIEADESQTQASASNLVIKPGVLQG